uniref:RNA pseudouridine synthase 3, mitochondrial n=2 Tax=Noccaea caerulescens TaxID=107243 RepID=A0A1J3CCG6_NOCCA
MWKTNTRTSFASFRQVYVAVVTRRYSRVAPPPSEVIRVTNNIAHLGPPKKGALPRQLMSLPPFPGHPLPGKNAVNNGADGDEDGGHVTAISWVKYYFEEIHDKAIQAHFTKGLVEMEFRGHREKEEDRARAMRKIKHNEVMKIGDKIWLPVSIAETRISKRYDTIPSGTLYPNADEIAYLQRLVRFKDSAIIVLNKPPKLPVKGNVPIHNSMDALAAAALSFGNDEGPRLVHRLDRETSGLLVMGRSKESIDHLHSVFSDFKGRNSRCKAWNKACETMYQQYWALVIGSPKDKEGIISVPLSKVLLDDGKTDRVVLARGSGFEASQEAITEYRVLGPMINGCSWLELRPITSRKHQLRVHCAEALGTPIVGDYKYGWFVHKRWKQMPQVDIEPTTGKPYKLRRSEGLDIQKGSVLSKVPLLHLHCREMVLPNIAKFLHVLNKQETDPLHPKITSKPDLLRFVASMPSHMKISWNIMSSYLV